MINLKFRYWNKDAKIMSGIFTIQDIINGKMNIPIDDKGNPHEDHVVLMFNSDMYDKNDREIFVGDKVRSISHEPQIMSVDFIEGAFALKAEADSWAIDISHFYPSIGTDLEIIGNIYD